MSGGAGGATGSGVGSVTTGSTTGALPVRFTVRRLPRSWSLIGNLLLLLGPVERVHGIEPSSEAWKAPASPTMLYPLGGASVLLLIWFCPRLPLGWSGEYAKCSEKDDEYDYCQSTSHNLRLLIFPLRHLHVRFLSNSALSRLHPYLLRVVPIIGIEPMSPPYQGDVLPLY